MTAFTARQKALDLNLDSSWYGSFAEIGAGQEVARWFFRVGAAAGTVAKTMSAYDMQVSDAIYGKADRYVSRGRLVSMLDHDYLLSLERLSASRETDTRFFAFADTVAAQQYGAQSNCHGWMGIRFQHVVGGPSSEIVLHARLLDRDALQQHEALGILGVNLIYGAAYRADGPESIIKSLSDELGPGRLEVDMIEFAGEAFTTTDNRVMSLKLVEQGLTRAAMFAATGEVIQPSEAFYKKSVLVQRGRFRPPTLVHADIQSKSMAALAARHGIRPDEIVHLAEMTLRELQSVEKSGVEDFMDRITALTAGRRLVMVSDFRRPWKLLEYVLGCGASLAGFAINAPEFRKLFSGMGSEDPLFDPFETARDLFLPHVSILVYPAIGRSTGQRISFADLDWSESIQHLMKFLLTSNRICELEGLSDEMLRFRSDEVLELIRSGSDEWTRHVEADVARVIREERLFDLPS